MSAAAAAAASPPWWRRLPLGLIAVVLGLVLWLGYSLVGARTHPPELPSRLALVLPDAWQADDPLVLAWQDAASELGFALELVSASQLMRDTTLQRQAALILPDTVHRRMNDALLGELQRIVLQGGRLMLVHDAGIADMNGQYHPQQSRLSTLAGVRYGLYGELRTAMIREQEAWVDAMALPLLQLPPGKLMREDSDRPLTSAQTPPQPGEELAVVGYHYGRLRYPVFATAGNFDGQRLMLGDHQTLLAGLHAVGRGQVLFVNLPLTYLKLRTDGLFLHTFLRFFAQHVVQLPQLSPMPEARGALVMNWHIDSAAAVPAMEKLAELGAFQQGPYSVHLTAGPDVDKPGDHLGMDLLNNPAMQNWVRRFADRGDEVGSHGGWIHNEFGRLIDHQARSLSTALIERNSDAVKAASGKPVLEYSAPSGNHPAWVTPWLHDRGVRAYYFTGDVGMAPTRSYQEGRRGPADMWAFPVLSYGLHAAFEEARVGQVAEADLAAWLNDVSDYCADNLTVRLVYFHPPGVTLFPQAFQQWLTHTAALVQAGRLRWTTMAQYATFANRRAQVRWQQAASPDGGLRLAASHPQSLDQMTWLLPVARHGQPQVLEGSAQVQRDGEFWRVTSGAAARLALTLPPAPAQPAARTAPVAPAAPSTPSPASSAAAPLAVATAPAPSAPR